MLDQGNMLQIIFCTIHRKMALLCEYHIKRTEMSALFQ